MADATSLVTAATGGALVLIGAVSAVAAWRSAGASERAAKASERTSRDAMEALGMAIVPELGVEPMAMFTEPVSELQGARVQLSNGPFECRDVEVEATIANLQPTRHREELIRPNEVKDVPLPHFYEAFPEWDRSLLSRPHPWGHLEGLRVRYWDARRIMRYEQSYQWRWSEDRRIQQGGWPNKERIEGPEVRKRSP